MEGEEHRWNGRGSKAIFSFKQPVIAVENESATSTQTQQRLGQQRFCSTLEASTSKRGQVRTNTRPLLRVQSHQRSVAQLKTPGQTQKANDTSESISPALSISAATWPCSLRIGVFPAPFNFFFRDGGTISVAEKTNVCRCATCFVSSAATSPAPSSGGAESAGLAPPRLGRESMMDCSSAKWPFSTIRSASSRTKKRRSST